MRGFDVMGRGKTSGFIFFRLAAMSVFGLMLVVLVGCQKSDYAICVEKIAAEYEQDGEDAITTGADAAEDCAFFMRKSR